VESQLENNIIVLYLETFMIEHIPLKVWLFFWKTMCRGPHITWRGG
jgi:hypothetical protein